ncbi:MAG: Hint domain-containing protein [Paracoccaceae bacterium]
MSLSFFCFDLSGNKCDVASDCVTQHDDGCWYDNHGTQCHPKLDGYVEGTTGNDVIDYNYTGDPEGDKIDHNDAVLGNAHSNDDIVYAYGGNDTVLAGAGNDLVYGGTGNDNLSGQDGNDTVYGDNGSDTMSGGAGNDVLYGGPDGDTIYGGAGSDLVDGGAGNDLIDTSNSLQSPDIGYPGLYPADSAPNDDKDTIVGGQGDDTIRTGDDADSIHGNEGADSIDAGVDNDTVFGDAGNDTIIGAEGADVISGGSGDDVVYGGYGPGTPDLVNIPDATDLAPGNGTDLIHGDEGNDTLFGMDDKDTIYGDANNDVIYGGIDDDSLFGGSNNDVVHGDDGNDRVFGDDGNDSLSGGAGADSVFGGSGADLIVGGNTGDFVDGGEQGNDHDTLDLTGAGPLHIIYDPTNPENGTVNFLDPTDHHVTGTLTFQNIENVIPCFTPGTLIATPRGEVAVESLQIGDRIITRDNGMQEIRWIGKRELSWRDLSLASHLKPVLVRQGALGNGVPERDMLVSPNHRLLVANDRTALYFDEHEVLVAAKHLVQSKGVYSVDTAGVTYVHFMCDRHEVVLSNGAWTESFQPGDYSLKGMGNSQRAEIYDLFPALRTEVGLENYGAARRTLKRHEALLIGK